MTLLGIGPTRLRDKLLSLGSPCKKPGYTFGFLIVRGGGPGTPRC